MYLNPYLSNIDILNIGGNNTTYFPIGCKYRTNN